MEAATLRRLPKGCQREFPVYKRGQWHQSRWSGKGRDDEAVEVVVHGAGEDLAEWSVVAPVGAMGAPLSIRAQSIGPGARIPR